MLNTIIKYEIYQRIETLICKELSVYKEKTFLVKTHYYRFLGIKYPIKIELHERNAKNPK